MVVARAVVVLGVVVIGMVVGVLVELVEGSDDGGNGEKEEEQEWCVVWDCCGE